MLVLVNAIDASLSQIIIDDFDFLQSFPNDLIDLRLKSIQIQICSALLLLPVYNTPKGVVLNHKSFIDFTEWAIDTLKINDNEVIGSLSPLVFDIYSFELCMLMAKGSTIVILPDSLAAFPAKILSLLKENKVTFLLGTDNHGYYCKHGFVE